MATTPASKRPGGKGVPRSSGMSVGTGGKGKLGGLGSGFARNKHRKILKDTVQGICMFSPHLLTCHARPMKAAQLTSGVYSEGRLTVCFIPARLFATARG
jgi:hypothetical protein